MCHDKQSQRDKNIKTIIVLVQIFVKVVELQKPANLILIQLINLHHHNNLFKLSPIYKFPHSLIISSILKVFSITINSVTETLNLPSV